jgi:hypothetical protein
MAQKRHPIRQRQGGTLHHDAEVRSGASHGVRDVR